MVKYKRMELLHNFHDIEYKYAYSAKDNKGNFYAIPTCAGNVLKYNVTENRISFLGEIEKDNYAYTGGVFDEKRNCIWGFPRNSNCLLKINISDESIQEIPLGIKFVGTKIHDSHHYNGVLVNDVIYCPPRSKSNGILKINLVDMEASIVDIDNVIGRNMSYSGIVHIKSMDALLLLPSKGSIFTLFYLKTGKICLICDKVDYFCFGAIEDIEGNIYFACDIGIGKVSISEKRIDILKQFPMREKVYGVVQHNNKNIYCYGNNSNSVYEYSPKINQLKVVSKFYDVNKRGMSSYTMGELMEDENIYLVPCFGRFFSRLKFEGIEEKNTTSIRRNWFVTGGATGLGRSLVLFLYEQGYNVVATSRDLAKLDDLPKGIIKCQMDVRSFESCENAIKLAIQEMGAIDVLVNNAGVSHTSTFEETPMTDGENIINTNFWGIVNTCKAIIPYFRQRKSKNSLVINISSASAFRERNYGSYYVSSKFAVDSLTKSLKYECSDFADFIALDFGGMNTGLMNRQLLIHTKYDEYKSLPENYYVNSRGRTNDVHKAVLAVYNVSQKKNLPRNIVLGWDAVEQYKMVLDKTRDNIECYKNISILTDEAKRNEVSIESITEPRNRMDGNKVWLITGGSGGFGKSLALRLNEMGYKVAITSRNIRTISGFPDDILKIQSELDTVESCEKVIECVKNEYGQLNVLVNNATCNCWSSFEECPYDIMENVFNVNYFKPTYMMKAYLPLMRQQKSGTVINITSIAAVQPRARVSMYSAAKSALEGLTHVLQSECQRFGRFMIVEPVCMQTEIMKHNPIIQTSIEEYENKLLYTPEISNQPNRVEVLAQLLINYVSKDTLPTNLLVGTESVLIAENELKMKEQEFNENIDISMSIYNGKDNL